MHLESGVFTAEIRPEIGGLVAAWTWRRPEGDRPLLRPPTGEAPSVERPTPYGLWPLVPFANRAFDGLVDDGIRPFRVACSEPGRPDAAIHGFGWQSAWDVVGGADDRVHLRHRRASGPDPYRYTAEETVTLIGPSLRIDLVVTNDAAEPLPFGLGLHPWFPADDATRLTFRAERELTLGPGYRGTGAVPLAPDRDFAAGRPVRGPAELVASLVGWDGRARLDQPTDRYALEIASSPSLSAPLLWAPADADFVCFEPQTHAIGAPSEPAVRALTPLARLNPGESLAVWMTLTVGPA